MPVFPEAVEVFARVAAGVQPHQVLPRPNLAGQAEVISQIDPEGIEAIRTTVPPIGAGKAG